MKRKALNTLIISLAIAASGNAFAANPNTQLAMMEPTPAAASFEPTAITGADPQPQTAPQVLDPKTPLASVRKETPFQAMVKESIGSSLPVFGLNFFSQAIDTASLNAIPATSDYVIGVGDEIVVRATGSVDINYRATVDQNGVIFIPKVGTIFAAGTKYQDLSEKVATAIGYKYRNFSSTVTLGQLRGSQILVVGQVERPGSYVLPPYATTVNALLAAGGPNENGSLRRVVVKNNGKLVKVLDLYKLLAEGDKAQDLRLQPGDVVLVNPVGKQVAISGEVKTPAIFEMVEGESYNDLVKYAGGFTVTARPQEMRVEHVDQQTRRAVSSLALSNINSAVKNGDIVRVPSVIMDYSNAVTIRGAVSETMRTPWKADMRVADLIQSRDNLIVPTYWHEKNQLAAATDKDRLTTSGKTEVNWDYAVIERLNKDTMETDLIPFNLRKAMDRDPQHNAELKAGDVVTVFSKDQLGVPEQSRSRYVRLEGEVKSPGIYKAEAGDTLRTLIVKAGGLTDQAYLYGAQFYRDSTRATQQKQMEVTVAKLEESARLAAADAARNASTLDDVRAAKEQAASNMAVVSALRNVKATGRIVLEVPNGRNSVRDIPDLKVEDNDKLVIPAMPSTVAVSGAVYNENTYLYKPRRSPEDYLKLAGGVMPGVSHAKILVSRADGSIVKANDVDNLNPGDTVIAVDDTSKKSFTKVVKDWAQIFYQFGLAAAGVNVLK